MGYRQHLIASPYILFQSPDLGSNKAPRPLLRSDAPGSKSIQESRQDLPDAFAASLKLAFTAGPAPTCSNPRLTVPTFVP
jgi:hypothetical protein